MAAPARFRGLHATRDARPVAGDAVGEHMNDTPGHLLLDDPSIAALVRAMRRVAVLGIKPETHADQPAFYVPRYLVEAGLEVVPVPVYYPEVTSILGAPVVRRLADVAGRIDVVDVFRRPRDVAQHLPELLAARPRAVWLQSGIRDDETAAALVAAGIDVVQDRCLMVEHRRFASR